MADKFPPGFEFRTQPANKREQLEPAAGVEFRVTPESLAPEPLPPVDKVAGGLDPDTLARRVGTLAFERRQPIGTPGSADLRSLTVGGLSTAGEIAGARFGPLGAAAGSGAGGFAGSLLSEAFDPSTNPLPEAFETGAVTAAFSAGASGIVLGAKRLLSKPNEAAKTLIEAAKREGKLPTAAEAFPDSKLISLAQSIGQADIAFERHVTGALKESRGRMTTELRQWLESYVGTRGLAKQKFTKYDALVKDSVGSTGVVPISDELFEAMEPLLAVWKRARLDPQLDVALIPKIEQGLARIRQKGGVRVETPKLSLAEIQAVEDRLQVASIDAATGANPQIGGITMSQGFKKFAREANDAMDAAIDAEIATGKLPLAAKVELTGARQLWKEWKSGEVILNALKAEFEVAQQSGGLLQSGTVFGVIRSVRNDAANGFRMTTEQVDNLGRIGRALALSEKTEKTKMFTWVVRAGQLGLLVGSSTLAPSDEARTGSGLFILFGPQALAKLTTSKKTVALLLRGMQVEAGTEAAIRATRQFALAAFREGVFPPERLGFTTVDPSNTLIGNESLPAQLLLRPLPPQPVPQRNPALPGVNPTFPPPGATPATIVDPRLGGAPRG